ncbi:hypothetical protein CRG98_008468 [Punica granatum]|uniref:Uncharacterized protein n=1 Tax=Punica granatum TaxID=22663 RepID=A0A2I0KS68_PUNGR|nr:hypothetical protein CRG98_008468 [Punica granatum]
MASSRKWARFISSIASFTYFSLVIFQVPLFRVPCRTGTCKSPLQVTSSQLIASEFFPEPVVKALLYPGAVAASVLKKKALPSYNDLLKSYDSIHVKEVRAAMDLKRIEENLLVILENDLRVSNSGSHFLEVKFEAQDLCSLSLELPFTIQGWPINTRECPGSQGHRRRPWLELVVVASVSCAS